jgi:dihydrofolate reductase
MRVGGGAPTLPSAPMNFVELLDRGYANFRERASASETSPPSRPIHSTSWPALSQRSASPPPTLPLPTTASFIVVSTTLEEPLEWSNSTLIKSNVAKEITELNRRLGKDITILGSGALVWSLLPGGLLDELRLKVYPVVLGGGKRLFEDGGERKDLELVDSRMFDMGVLYLTYRPVSRRAGFSK